MNTGNGVRFAWDLEQKAHSSVRVGQNLVFNLSECGGGVLGLERVTVYLGLLEQPHTLRTVDVGEAGNGALQDL